MARWCVRAQSGGGGRRRLVEAEPGPRRNAREGASPSLFLANSSVPVRKNSFQCVADAQDVFVGIAPGRRKLCKSCRKSFAQKRPLSRAQESWGPARLPRGGMPRNRLGEPPAQSPPLPSNPRVNNLPQSALETHKRGAAVGWRGRDAEPALARSAPALREASTEVRGRVWFQLLLGCLDHHRRPPNSLEWALPPWERQSCAAGEGAKCARGPARG